MYLKRILLFFVAITTFFESYAQRNMLSTTTLEKNAQHPNKAMVLQAINDNVEDRGNDASVKRTVQPVEKEELPVHYRGFGHYTEIGALAATKNRPDNVTTAAFSFQTVNGYTFSRWLFTGIGVAADLYATQTTIPVFASVRGNLIKGGRFIPFYFIDGGYGIDITSSTTDISYKGGAMFSSGIGFKIPVNNGVGFMVSFGYRMQKGSTIQSGIEKDYTNNRIALRAGFYL
ncbi:MAG: hypothetical protein QM802_22850 [Agriterribacter sp.]